MALRRSSRSTTVAATQKSANDAAVRNRKRADRQASRAKTTLKSSLVQPTQPTQPSQPIQPTQPVGQLPQVRAVTGSKRRRDDDDESQTGSRKKRQPEASLSSAVATVPERADQASRAENDHSAPEANPAIEQDGPIRADGLNGTIQANAVLGVTEGAKLLNALFALVSRSHLMLQKEERRKEYANSFTRRHEAAARVEKDLEDLERGNDLRPVSEEHLALIAENKKNLRLFQIGKASSAKDVIRFEEEIDTLQRQIEVGVNGLHTYSETLEDDPALHIFANREPFWKIFAALTASNRATESVNARFKAIEDEKLAISSQMDNSFEHDLANRFAKADPGHTTVNTTENLAEANTGTLIDQHLQRLADLASEERILKRHELFRDVGDVDSLSKELLRLAERAFVQAGLLEPDGSTILTRREEPGTPKDAPKGQMGAEPSRSPSAAASESERGEIILSREEQASNRPHAQEHVSSPASEEANTSPLAIAATMNRMDIQKKFEQVRDDFRIKKKEFEEGKYRHLIQEDLAAYPQPLSEGDKGVLLVLKLESHTEAFRLAEENFHAWREVAVQYGIEPEIPDKSAAEIAPDRSDDGYPDVIFVAKKEKAGPQVQLWRSDARLRKSPSSASSRRSSINTRLRDMASLALDEDVQDEVGKSLWPIRINEIEQIGQDLRKAGPFEAAENDFHPSNRTKPKRTFPGVERAASI